MRRDPLATARGCQPRPDSDNRPDRNRVSCTDTFLGHGGAGAWGMALSGGSSGCGNLRNPRSAQAILRQLGEEADIAPLDLAAIVVSHASPGSGISVANARLNAGRERGAQASCSSPSRATSS
jgi:hypothetical protein